MVQIGFRNMQEKLEKERLPNNGQPADWSNWSANSSWVPASFEEKLTLGSGMLQFNVVFQVSNYELGAIPTLL